MGGLLIGAAAFAAASVWAAFATSPLMLIGCRAALGIAGATLGPATLSLIGTMFRDARQQAFAVAVWMSCFIGGTAVGPLVGGVLLVTGPALLPEFRAANPGRLDPASVALSLAAILPTIYGLKELARHGVAPLPVAVLAAGLGFGALFVARQRRLVAPLVDLRLFANRTFRGGIALMLVGGLFLGGVTLLVTQFLQVVTGLPALRAGLLLVPPVIAMSAASWRSGWPWPRRVTCC